MLKTNSKKAKENIKKYIMENTAAAFMEAARYAKNNEEIFPYNDNKFIDRAAFIWDKFNREKSETYKKSYFVYHKYEVFKDWGQGLACGCLFEFLLHKAVDDLGAILEETETETEKYTEDQASEKLFQLLYREIYAGKEKYKMEAKQ